MKWNRRNGNWPAWDSGLPDWPDKEEGYYVYNLEQVEKVAPDLMYMPVVYHKDEFTCHALEKNISYIGVEAIFASDNEEIVSDAYIDRMHKQGLMLFGNAIVYNEKANISAGHTDDIALKDSPDFGWGWFAEKKFDIIQTDWPLMLKMYLEQNNLLYR
mgnify:CR=1 FL=1